MSGRWDRSTFKEHIKIPIPKFKYTFKGVEDEKRVIKTCKTRWISEKDMRQKMIYWYRVWCFQVLRDYREVGEF